MQRRTVLSALGTVVTGTLAGCFGSSSSTNPTTNPSTENPPTSVPARTPNDDGELQAAELHDWLEDDSEDFAVDVQYLAVVGDELRVRYVSNAGSGTLGDTQRNERVVVAGRYAEWEDDHRGIPLRATVVDEFDDPQYRWRCESDWATQYRNDEASLEALREKVAETVTDV